MWFQTAQTRDNEGLWKAPESKTTSPLSHFCLICKTSITTGMASCDATSRTYPQAPDSSTLNDGNRIYPATASRQICATCATTGSAARLARAVQTTSTAKCADENLKTPIEKIRATVCAAVA